MAELAEEKEEGSQMPCFSCISNQDCSEAAPFKTVTGNHTNVKSLSGFVLALVHIP